MLRVLGLHIADWFKVKGFRTVPTAYHSTLHTVLEILFEHNLSNRVIRYKSSGPSPSSTRLHPYHRYQQHSKPRIIKPNLHLYDQLSFTTKAIKEYLHLLPIVATSREGERATSTLLLIMQASASRLQTSSPSPTFTHRVYI